MPGTLTARSCEDSQVKIGRKRTLRSSIRPSISTENPIPEKVDHREIAVRVPVMNEVQFLLASEPCKPPQPRSLYVVCTNPPPGQELESAKGTLWGTVNAVSYYVDQV